MVINSRNRTMTTEISAILPDPDDDWRPYSRPRRPTLTSP